MAEIPNADWAQYKRVSRSHADGNHALCDYHRCEVHRQLWQDNEYKLMAMAVLRLLDQRGIDAADFFGEFYDAAKALATKEFPDYDYLPSKPDRVTLLAADPDVLLMYLRQGIEAEAEADTFDYDAFFGPADAE